ncbi:hypothetical protein OnM2_084045 [Erysiphe neolycopersici]|uniref:Uncharacterized protein n=1 Tax=Erysiphe neolycopersici TaxID=212602 RepID=A0A420HEX1_9PEZI|nr:hypothetical protein OnM2_084045 [Erysiphe neolycopersici]
MALVPYNLWAMKVPFVMDDDFQQVATWAKRSTVTWLDLVEAVLQVLRSDRKLYSPMTSFARLKPDKNETDLDFAKKHYLPSLLLHLENRRDKLPLATLIREFVRVNKLQSQNVNFKSEMENRTPLPSISNPIFEDRSWSLGTEL